MAGHRRAAVAGEVLLAAAVLAAVGAAVAHEGGRLGPSLGALGHLRWGWVAAAVVVESGSMATFARLQRRLVRAGGAELGLGAALATTYAGNAISLSIPVAGSGIATAWALRRIEAHGVDRPTATFALAVAGVFSTTTLAGIVAVAAIGTGQPAAASAGVVGAVAVTAAAVVAAVVVHRAAARRALERVVARVLAGALRLARRPERPGLADAVASAGERLATLHLGGAGLAAATSFATLNWLLDTACFYAAVRAAGGHVGVAALVLAWSAGSAAGSLGVTPGGIGVIEAALIAALVAAGLGSPRATTAVVAYRLVSLVLVVAVGYVVLAGLRLAAHRSGRSVSFPADGLSA